MSKAKEMWRLRLSRILPSGFFFLSCALAYGVTLLPTGRVVGAVIVEMQLQQSSRAELFWNTFTEDPVWIDVTGGRRSTIKFHPRTSGLSVLRIDPSQRAQEEIFIYRIAIRFGDGSEFEIPLGTIANWNFQNTTKPILTDGHLTFRSITTDPYLYGPVNILPSSSLERAVAFAQNQVRSSELIVQLAIVGAIVAALTSLALPGAILFGLGMLGSLVLLYVSPVMIERVIGPDFHDVSRAISMAAFRGQSVGPSRWATLLTVLAAVVVAVAVWTWTRVNSANALLETNRAPVVAESGPLQQAMIAILSLLALLLVLAPDLKGIAEAHLASAFYYHWDSHNITTWAGFVAQGKRPYVDFWYPYFGLWIFDLPMPYGVLFRYTYLVILYWTLGMVIWRLTDRQPLIWFAIVLLIVLLANSGTVPLPERYLLGVTVALSYVAASASSLNKRSGRLWFWIACALALWGEPAQIVYALPALFVVFVHDEFWINGISPRRALSRAIGDFAVPMMMLICFLGFLAVRGELQGFIENNRLTAASAIYAVMPANLADEFPVLLNITSIGVVAPFLLLPVGMMGLLKSSTYTDQRLGLAVLCCATVGIMVLQKHLIRPIGAQLLGPSIVGALLVFPLVLSQSGARALVATISGAMTAAVLLNPTLSSLARNAVLGAAGRVQSDYQVLANEPELFERVRTIAFSRSRMANYQSELATIDKLRTFGKKSWFALTDMPIFYLFSDGSTPFQINHYNTSPVRAQVDVRSWLSRTKPDAVILDPAALSFDGIQLVVREPLVANEVILNYVPLDRAGSYHLLTRREDGKPIDLAYWREILGHRVEYGRALGYTRAPWMPGCTTVANASCIRYLELTFDTEATAPQPFDLPIMVGPFEFQVSFVREPGAKHQYVPIDRIWFWVAGEAMAHTPNPRLPAGVSARIVAKLPGGEVLY